MIEIRSLIKRFGSQTVLDGISLSLASNKMTAIVGPSGVGKSVLVKLIMGILPADSGQILVDGVDVTALSSEQEKNIYRQKLGVLFQGAALFDSLTILQNIMFPLIERRTHSLKEVEEQALDIMKSLSLVEFADRLPQEVSIGMRKRAGLARALICRPKILLFDEPNTGLDPKAGQEVYDLIKLSREKWQFTGLVISHELPEVFQVSDEVVMLLGGSVVFQGTPAELTASSNPAVQQFLHGKKDGPITIR